GFRFVIEKQRFDIWALPDTWAFKNGFASGSDFPDLLKTSFFNVDAACYHVNQHELFCLDGYEDWVKDGLLDINLAHNPNPMNMARRALVLMQTHQLGMTRRLAQFVVTSLDHQTLTWTEQLMVKKLTKFVATDGLGEFRFSLQSELVT
ncbi:MAG TPA: hypothetical protein VGJ72_18500, partial [Polaromonas sp.]